jgi:uncharacterized repeat protein (TIGR01451 family)
MRHYREEIPMKQRTTARRRVLPALGAAVAAFAIAPATALAATPDLSIEKSDSADPATEGIEFTYTLTVANAGPDAANGVAVDDDVPNGLDIGGATPSQGSCDIKGHKLSCALGELQSGGTAAVTIRVTPRKSGAISNTATVTTTDADPVAANNSDTETTTINPPAAAPTCAKRTATIVGTTGDDDLVGTPGNDVIAALGGNDSIDGGGGKDLICSAAGLDVVRGNTGADLVRAGGGRDRVRGGSGGDTLRGGGGKDRLKGNGGNDALLGGTGRDKCRGGPGHDTKRSC